MSRVANLARQFRDNPPPVESPAEIFENLASNPEECQDPLNELRPELYALSALVIDSVMDDAVEGKDKYPPHGLVLMNYSPAQKVLGLHTLGGLLRTTINNSVERVVDSYEAENSPIIWRLGSLCVLFKEYTDEERYDSVTNLLLAGTGTASTATTSALRAVARLVRNENPAATSSHIAATARASRIMPAKTAAVNIDYLGAANGLIAHAGEVPSRLTPTVDALKLMTRADGTQYVDFKKPLLKTQNPNIDFPWLIGEGATHLDTLGCPALVDLDESSSIDRLWEWAIDIAEAEDLFTKDTVYTSEQSIPAKPHA